MSIPEPLEWPSGYTPIDPHELEPDDSFLTDDGAHGTVVEKAAEGLYVDWHGEEANRPIDSLVTYEELGPEVGRS